MSGECLEELRSVIIRSHLCPSASQAVDLLLDSEQILQVLGNKRSKR